MPTRSDLTILVPIDISMTEPPALEILDLFRPIDVVLLGYFFVPDQAEPALIKDEYESDASARLNAIAADHSDLTDVLVFTHDREATIDRVADQYGCDAVLTAGDTAEINRILVPLRGDANLDHVISVVADIALANAATVTLFHALAEDTDPSYGEFLLQQATDRLLEHELAEPRIDWELSGSDHPHTGISDLSHEHDLVILGETEPSLRERIIGDVLLQIIDAVQVPALIVRNIE